MPKLKQIVYYSKLIRYKIICYLLYRRYVKDNIILQGDILENFKRRGCRGNDKSLAYRFYHLILHYDEFRYVFFFRTSCNRWWFSPTYKQEFASKIFKSTQIASGLTCYHPFATVINAKSIGQNFEFRNGLTIGNKNNDNAILPVLGNNVTVGANVSIIGGITIGDSVIIGAGSVVVKDVPSCVIVAGNPAKIIRKL
ncbi:serine acetyltransferase [Winogradskyella undariae]|uniref:serine acetyltransferase n=1 Tax=Winogradskyella undariae TaxID=1285465 RepID=UPI0015CD2A85|nr:serine acetyltransferase [Winogradskyella undariae]